MNPSITSHSRPSSQRGGFLLEALVGILIFTLGVLGLVALQARAIAYTGDAQHRGEAAYLANSYISKMWADSRANIPLRYAASGQTEFDALEQAVFTRLPGAAAIPGNPSVTIVQPGPAGTADALGNGTGITLTGTGTVVSIVISWQPPRTEGSSVDVVHNYTMTSIIAHN
jgi:type IV pilus assembly protein PilV